MKSREDLLRGAVGKLRPENSLREKVLSGAGRAPSCRPVVRRFSLAGAACLAVLAVFLLLPGLLDVSVLTPDGAGASAQDTPSLSIESGEEQGAAAPDGQEDSARSILIGVMNDGAYLDAVAVAETDPLSERVSCMFVGSSCAVDVEGTGSVPIGELYRLGGAELFETKVEELLDLSVDGAVVLSYDALASFVDAEGGASVFLLGSEAAYLNECNDTLRGVATEYTEGTWRLDGQEAMWFLLFSADGENQLTSRSGRRVALAESIWSEASAGETSAHLEDLLAGALDSTLPALPDEETIASRLSYRFDCIAVPDDPMSIETGYDAEGRELTLYDLSELRQRVKDFFLSEEIGDMLASTVLPPYAGGELSPEEQAAAAAFLEICGQDTDGLSVTVPAVSLASWEGPDGDGVITASAACLCRRYRLEGNVLMMEGGDQKLAASFRFLDRGDGSFRLLSTDALLTDDGESFGDYQAYLDLTGGNEEAAVQLFDLLVGAQGAPLSDGIESALMAYRADNGLQDRLFACEVPLYATVMTPVSLPITGTLTIPEGTVIEVESGEGWSFVPERQQEFRAYFEQEEYSYVGRFRLFDAPAGLRFLLKAPDGSVEHELTIVPDGCLLADGLYVYELPRFLDEGDFGTLLSEEYQRALESGELGEGFEP